MFGSVPGCSFCPVPAAQSTEMQSLKCFAFSRGYSRGDGASETPCLPEPRWGCSSAEWHSDMARREKGSLQVAETLSEPCVLPAHTAEEAHKCRVTLTTSKSLPWCEPAALEQLLGVWYWGKRQLMPECGPSVVSQPCHGHFRCLCCAQFRYWFIRFLKMRKE